MCDSTYRHSLSSELACILDRRLPTNALNMEVASKICFRTHSESVQRMTRANFVSRVSSTVVLMSAALSAATSSNLGMELWCDALDGFNGTTWLFPKTMQTTGIPSLPTTRL